MKEATLILRSLWHRRLGVSGLALAMAIAAAAVAGGLIVGDSLRASVKKTLLARLDGAQLAVVSAAPVRAELAGELSQLLPAARCQPLLSLQGVLQRDEASPSLSGFTLLGIDRAAARQLLGRELSARELGVPQPLAAELALRDGQDILVGVPRLEGEGASLFAHRRTDRLLKTVRRTVHIIPAGGLTQLSLQATQESPRNLLLDRESLADVAGSAGEANLLLLFPPPGAQLPLADVQHALAQSAQLSDVGLRQQGDFVQARNFILPPVAVAAVHAAAARAGGRTGDSSIYLADRITLAARGAESSYALIAAIDGHDLRDNEIALNQWLADDLRAAVGDRLRLEYLLPRDDGASNRRQVDLVVRRVMPVQQPGARDLLPPVPGVSDAQRIDAWEAPFPLEMSRITPRDDEYWKQYRATPKAYVSPLLLQSIWNASGAVGSITGIQLDLPPGAASHFQRELVTAMVQDGSGLLVRDLRQEALSASEGSSDFGSLFAGMSLFLVISAAAIALTLAKLGLEARAKELGMLQACGFSRPRLVLMLSVELGAVVLVASLAGIVFSIAYARLLLRLFAQQQTIPWQLPPLVLDARPASLVAAVVCCSAMGVLALWQAWRFLGRLSAVQLLRSGMELPAAAPRRGGLRLPASLAIASLLALLSPSWLRGLTPAAAFLPAAACLLLATLLLVRRGLGRPPGNSLSTTSLILSSLASRRKSSLLTVSLFAVASFMLLSIALQPLPAPAAGGFSLRVTCAVAPGFDVTVPAGREKTGFAPADQAALDGIRLLGLWSRGSGDISCLNLARPRTARVLGVDVAAMPAGDFHLRTQPPGQGWEVLRSQSPQEPIPIIGDAESMTWILKRSLGETFDLPRDEGAPLRVRLVGLVEGGLFAGDVLMDRQAMLQAYGTLPSPSIFLVQAPPPRLESVRAALASGLSPFGPRIERVDAIVARVQSVQRLYMSFFVMLGGAGLLLGAAGQMAIMIRQRFERRQEISLLLAHGFTRPRVGLLLASEQLLLLLAGLAAGTLAALVPGLLLLRGPSAAGVLAMLAVVTLAGALAIALPLCFSIPRTISLATE